MYINEVSCILDNIYIYSSFDYWALGTIRAKIHMSCWIRGACWLLPNSYNIFLPELPESVFCIQEMTFDYSAKCH